MASVSVADMRAHIAFLRDVHVHSIRDESSSLYFDGPHLRAAVSSYISWLVEASVPCGSPWSCAGQSPGETLVTRAPPLPVAWCWHVHRLDPHAYFRDCASLVAAVPYPAPGVGFAWHDDDADAALFPTTLPDSRAAPPSDLDDRLVAAIGRHAPFLWQVSGAAYNDDAFLLAAASRYEGFVEMTVRTGGAVLAPPIDIDLAWHTHMLRDSEYLRESAAMRGPSLGAMAHDNGEGMGAHGDTSRLEAPWQNTLAAFRGTVQAVEVDEATLMKSAFEAAVPRGARHRGYAPAWWFARGESVVVIDDFLTPEECEAVISQMPGPESAMNCPSGKKAQMYVDGDASIEQRIRSAVSVGLGFVGEPEASKSSLALEEIMNRATGVNGSRADQFDPHRSLTVDRTTKSVKLPARVSVGTMHPHRDRLAIYTLEGETMFEDDTLTADGYTCVVYLKADGGTLVLDPDDAPGYGDAGWTPPGAKLTRHEIDVRPGRLVAWPNHAFKHCAGRRDVVEGVDATAESRWLLGPFHFTPGRARLPQVGDCGSAGSYDSSPPPPPPPPFEEADIWPGFASDWPSEPPKALEMRRSEPGFVDPLEFFSRNLFGNQVTRTYSAVLKNGEIPLSEPFRYCQWSVKKFWIPGQIIPALVAGQNFLESYTIGMTLNPGSTELKYSEIAVHNSGEKWWWIIPGFPGACFGYCCALRTERERGGLLTNGGFIGRAKEPKFSKSMVRFQLIEANENELRYAREGKDATVAYELEGSREAQEKGSDGFAKWLKDTKRKIFDCEICSEFPNDDARIRDFTGEMIIREEEIVLTESYDGREPYTITLKLQK